jgi:outer membrane protein assembly factor BamD
MLAVPLCYALWLPGGLLGGLLGGSLSGCGGAQRQRSLTYGESARELYELGVENLRSDNCQDAEPLLRRVRREYSYSRYAALAELRLADCLFKAQKYAEAIGAYRAFVRHRPSHPEVPYARFKIAEAYFEQMPEDFILAAPAAERDQGPTRDALRQLRGFILDYPDDPRVGDANRMIEQCLTLLAKHELYVADYYLGQGHPRAAILRLETLLRAYRGSRVEPEALLLLGKVHLQMRDEREARRVFEDLTQRFPNSGYAQMARGYLQRLPPR